MEKVPLDARRSGPRKPRDKIAALEIDTVYLHITHACNLSCRYCYADAGPIIKGELSRDEIKALLRDIAKIQPRKLVFTGGEPMLRHDLFDAAASVREADPYRRIHLCLISNGTLIDEENASQIVKLFDEVRISIDGPEDINDKLRGARSFNGALAAMGKLKRTGLALSVSITVTSLNLPHLTSFLSFLFDKARVTNFHLTPVQSVGRAAMHPELVVPWRKIQLAVAGFWRKRFSDPQTLTSAGFRSLLSCGNCGIGSHINIRPDGSVYPCHVLSVPRFYLGNVKDMSLIEIIQNSEVRRQLRKMDFEKLAKADQRLRRLLMKAVCLGEIYRNAPEVFEND